MNEPLIRMTTAPAAYDGFGTTTRIARSQGVPLKARVRLATDAALRELTAQYGGAHTSDVVRVVRAAVIDGEACSVQQVRLYLHHLREQGAAESITSGPPHETWWSAR